MAQFSTGLGLAVLGGCILGAAAISSHRVGGEAFAQGTGGDRRIVSASVNSVRSHDGWAMQFAHRIWSDNAIDVRCLGIANVRSDGWTSWFPCNNALSSWTTVDNGTSSYLRADVDESRSVDAGDISAVLLDFGATTDNPPPPIDCTINAPR